MRILRLVFLCQFISLVGFAQTFQSEEAKGKYLDSLRRAYIADSQQRIKIENDLLARYRRTDDKEWLAFAELLKFSREKKTDENLVEKFVGEVETRYRAFPNIRARAYQIIAYHYFIGKENYEKAFDAYLQLEKLLETNGPKVITDYANYCSEIASAHYKFKNHDKAVELAKKGLPYAADKWDFYNTIGLCYIQLSKLDSAIYYLQKAVKEAIALKKPDIYRTISLGNIGYSHYLQRKNVLAKPLLKEDLNGALRIDDKGLAVGAAIPLADIYLGEKKWSAADSLLILARNYISHSKQLDRLEKFYPVRSKYYQYLGKEKLALLYRDSAIWAIKRNDSVFNSLLVMRVQQRTDMVKLAEEKSKLENYQKISRIRLWAIFIILLVIGTGLLIVRRYRNRLRKDKKQIEELSRILALRQRLSADIHDDIGSTLSSISLYTHSLLMQPQNSTQQIVLEKIKQNAKQVQESLSDMVWNINPEMDLMAKVVARMRNFGAEMTETNGIEFLFEITSEIINLKIDMAARRNLYLIYKEAINNAVKYANCSTISVNLSIVDSNLLMTIIDNGVGFETAAEYHGNGLRNMQRRASESKGQLTIKSIPTSGTTVTLIIPIAHYS